MAGKKTGSLPQREEKGHDFLPTTKILPLSDLRALKFSWAVNSCLETDTLAEAFETPLVSKNRQEGTWRTEGSGPRRTFTCTSHLAWNRRPKSYIDCKVTPEDESSSPSCEYEAWVPSIVCNEYFFLAPMNMTDAWRDVVLPDIIDHRTMWLQMRCSEELTSSESRSINQQVPVEIRVVQLEEKRGKQCCRNILHFFYVSFLKVPIYVVY